MSSSDFFGLNSYSWCGQATYQTSDYDTLVSIFNESAVPVFVSSISWPHKSTHWSPDRLEILSNTAM